MSNSKQSYVTMCYDGRQGDKEFVLACKGRPFSVLTAPNFPTPAVTMVDYNLVRDLKLRMTDLQYAKLHYGGQKLRILGRISTSVQCISDGVQSGNLHFKANVVQDLYQFFDTHSIAGTKLSEKLIGPPFEVNQSEDSTEPTEAKIVKPNKAKKRKAKVTTAPAPRKEKQSKSEVASSDDDKSSDPTSPPKKIPPKSPPPRHQGRWIHHQYYNGWDPMLGYMVTNELRSKYVHKGTGDVTYEKPADYRSDGSYYFFDSESDEYPDVYTNISTIRQNDDSANNLQEVPSPTNSDLDMCDPDNHGPDQCHADCPWLGEENLPPDCGYHPRWGFVINCSASCPGHWCAHTRDSREAEEREGREAGVGGRWEPG